MLLYEETIRTVAALVGDQGIEALYVTGGGSELPLVARRLREEFGRRGAAQRLHAIGDGDRPRHPGMIDSPCVLTDRAS